jgi:glyoxylase-like metal-dependent hydrolase (beta-lactamase superfamily II)
VAGNGDAYTLQGTNTWIVASPEHEGAVVVDPGPGDPHHLAAIVEFLNANRLAASAIVLTHGHDDHADLASALHARTSAPVFARNPALCVNAQPLAEGQMLGVGSARVTVLLTPGHTSDSVSLVVPADRAVLTGDTFLGGTSTMLDYPDGVLSDYLDSLSTLIDIVDRRGIQVLLPGHGAPDWNPGRALEEYRSHRHERISQVAAMIRAGDGSDEEIADRIYPLIDKVLRPAATQNVAATRDYLSQTNVNRDTGTREYR